MRLDRTIWFHRCPYNEYNLDVFIALNHISLIEVSRFISFLVEEIFLHNLGRLTRVRSIGASPLEIHLFHL